MMVQLINILMYYYALMALSTSSLAHSLFRWVDPVSIGTPHYIQEMRSSWQSRYRSIVCPNQWTAEREWNQA